ncbi:hypothetical protein HK098_001716 [Nowakowskiella sp. JEL0407]|nr:hypothetical protein HK098_001716 [Nowakowskiella sp. JEL0407]
MLTWALYGLFNKNHTDISAQKQQKQHKKIPNKPSKQSYLTAISRSEFLKSIDSISPLEQFERPGSSLLIRDDDSESDVDSYDAISILSPPRVQTNSRITDEGDTVEVQSPATFVTAVSHISPATNSLISRTASIKREKSAKSQASNVRKTPSIILSPAYLPTLPPRVFRQISQYLNLNEQVQLMLICFNWSRQAAESFYQSPPLNNPSSLPKLIHLLSLSSSPLTEPTSSVPLTFHPYHLLIRELYFSIEASDDLYMGDIDQALNLTSTTLLSLHLEKCIHISNLIGQSISRYATNLKRLELPHCTPITDIFVPMVVDNCKGLERLDLKGTGVTIEGCFSLILERCEKLISLDLSMCRQSILNMKNPRRISVHGSLVPPPRPSTSLAGSRIPSRIIEEEIEFSQKRRNSSSNLPSNTRQLSIQTRTPSPLSSTPGSPSTPTSPLSRTLSKSIKSPKLNKSQTRIHLKSLNLSYTDVSNSQLLLLSLLPNLTFLSLSSCRSISDSSVGNLSQFCPHLKYLDLSHCIQITDTSVILLASLQELEWLELNGLNNPSAKSIQRIARNCQHLQFISLTGCQRILSSWIKQYAEGTSSENSDSEADRAELKWKDGGIDFSDMFQEKNTRLRTSEWIDWNETRSDKWDILMKRDFKKQVGEEDNGRDDCVLYRENILKVSQYRVVSETGSTSAVASNSSTPTRGGVRRRTSTVTLEKGEKKPWR